MSAGGEVAASAADRAAAATAAADRAALAAAATGDADAFAPLVERHQRRLLGLCERMLGDREAARDAVQEVFLKAYRKAASYRPRGAVYTWLYRIAVNHCLNRLRRRKVVRFLRLDGGGEEPGETPWLDPPDTAAGPDGALAARRRWAAVAGAIEELPPGQRAVLVLAKFEGLPYRRIAEVLEITPGAVESRLFRAMRKLESVVAAQESAPPRVPPARRTSEETRR